MKAKNILLILFFLAVTLSGYCQWTQQNLPVSGQINDMVFFDANTGIIAMNSRNILRTSDGGNNWNVVANIYIYNLNKADSTAIYGNGVYINNHTAIFRSYNRGLNWDSLSVGQYYVISSLFFFDRDTGLISGNNGNINVIWKTTNGGQSMYVFSTQTGNGILTFIKERYNNEYYGFHISYSSGGLSKTTNSGLNWINVPNNIGGGNYSSVFFLNKDTGWCYFDYAIKPSEFIYTSNGGINWNTQFVDSNSYGSVDIIFDKSGKYGWSGGMSYQKIFATSNGGVTWGFQNIPITFAYYFSFSDSLVGYCGQNNLAKTINGGGIITYIGIDSNNSKIPIAYKLNQNYPNPFNPSTTISFSLLKENYVSLKIYDITGKEILNLFNNKYLQSGNYKAVVNFNNLNVPSGVYFYSIIINDKNQSEVFKETKKMLYIK